jgi:hypothetical protein
MNIQEKTLLEENQKLRDALKEIQKGEGRYHLDPLEFATNTIESMITIATLALQGKDWEDSL